MSRLLFGDARDEPIRSTLSGSGRTVSTFPWAASRLWRNLPTA